MAIIPELESDARAAAAPRQLHQRADPPLPLPAVSATGGASLKAMPPLDPLPLAASASNLLAAREQMAFTLGFHIVLSCLGVALPATILVANYIGLKKGDEAAIELAKRWSKAMAVTFAVGAVTGTVLSFEFGLLWPQLHGPLRGGLRGRLRDRGDLLLPRGDLPRDLHLRLEAALPAGRTSGPGCRW